MSNRAWRRGILAAAASLSLSACQLDDNKAPAAAPAAPADPAPSQAATNVAPTITGTPAAEIDSNTTFLFQPSAADTDGDLLVFSATGLPGWASIDSATGRIVGTPADTDVGETADITVSVSDGETTARLTAFRVKVRGKPPAPTPPPPSNLAPVIGGAPATSVQATLAFSFAPTASDPEGRTLSFSISNKPSWAAFSTTTGRLSGTPNATQVRAYDNIVIAVSDGALSTALPAFSINVTTAPNRAPVIAGTPAITATVGTAYSFTPTGSDPDGNALTYSIANKPSWASFNTTNGRLAGTPVSTNIGTFSAITITVRDGALSAALAPFSIAVSAAPNTAPTITGTPPTSVAVGAAYSFQPVASDADGNSLAFSISGKPNWAAFSTATGAVTGTPTSAQAGSYANIVISVSDGTVSQALAAFSINVAQVANVGTAALSWSAPTGNTDGSVLSAGDLAGYRVYHGTSASALNDVFQVPGAATNSYTVRQLSSGTHYFAVTAVTVTGIESGLSTVGSKAIP